MGKAYYLLSLTEKAAKGHAPDAIAPRTLRYLERDWGIEVQPGKRKSLLTVLAESTFPISRPSDGVGWPEQSH